MNYYVRRKEFMTPIWATLLKYEWKPLGCGLSCIAACFFGGEKISKPHFEHKEKSS
jgi:hypothetical protein